MNELSYDKKENNVLFKKAKNIFVTSWISIGLEIAAIVLLIIMGIIPVATITNNNMQQQGVEGILVSSMLLGILSSILGGIVFVLNLTNAIIIFTTDFKNAKLNDSKIIWGIFTIIILGGISSLIFSIQAKNELGTE